MLRAIRRFLVLGLLLAATAAVGFWFDSQRVLGERLPVTAPTAFDIAPGSSFADVVSSLAQRGLIGGLRAPLYLRLRARMSGADALLKAGEYELTPGMTLLNAIDQFVGGRTRLHELTIVEGWSFAQALAAVRAQPALAQTFTGDAAAAMQAIGRPGVHPEGRLFPDTYHFPKGTSDVAFLRRAAAAMDRELQAAWDKRAPNLPYGTPEEALIMASIIEKETGAPAERPEISGVFVRRLQMGMRLQTDPTVIYGMGEKFDGNLRRVDLERDDPYNSYMRTGLPPSPICLPGRAALNAALQPAAGTALFFVSRGDGTHVFSATLAEHEAAVRKFQLKGR